MKVSAKEILKSITSAGQAPSSVLVIAPDQIRRRRVIDTILQTFLKGKSNSSMAVERIDGRDLKPDGLARFKDNANSLSLFSSRRFFVVSAAEELSETSQKVILELLSSQPKDCTFIFESAGLPASNVVRKFFTKNNALIELEQLKGPDLAAWVEREVRRQCTGNVEVDKEALHALGEIGDGDPDQIERLVEHLSLYVAADGKLDLRAIEEIFPQRFSAGEFEWLDAVQDGNLGKAEALLTTILRSGRSPFMLLGLVSKSFANLLRIASLHEAGCGPGQISEKTGIQPWLVNKQMKVIKRYSSKRLEECVAAIARADSLLKNRSLGAEHVFGQLISKLV